MATGRKALSRRDFLRLSGAGLAGMTLMTTGACAASGGGDALEDTGGGGTGGGSGSVVVGSTNFTEQLILANMYAIALEAEGVDVSTRLNLGSREVVFPSIESGELDIMPEYTGALLAFLTSGEGSTSEESQPTEEEAVLEALRSQMPEGLVALEPAPAQDKDVLVVTQETADEYGLQTIGDLAPVSEELVIGGPPEMEERRVGLPGLENVYGLEFQNFRSLDAGGALTVGALNNGDIDVGRAFSTQAVIDANNWVVLEDPENLVPAQNLIPIVRQDAITETIRSTLNSISAELTTDLMIQLNGRVSNEDSSPEAVAQNWLEEAGLVG